VKIALKIAAIVMMTFLSVHANAERSDVWHGWMNLTPCSKVEWTNDGIFGTPSPTLRQGPQELHGWLSADVPNTDWIIGAVQDCAARGVGAATVAGVLTSWGAAYPAFKAEFLECMSNMPSDLANKFLSSVDLRTETRCNY
jgi:hypothetical protein